MTDGKYIFEYAPGMTLEIAEATAKKLLEFCPPYPV